ncbi:lipase family protein [Sorangium sp. So ce1000]|uniref:lipase family protein n=1 Tax=Sorangium sp. So ce1000 TaxID=3133325 RepID=UPI003F5DA730
MKFQNPAPDPGVLDPDEASPVSEGAAVAAKRQESAKSGGKRRLIDRMVSMEEGRSDPEITTLLARASMWAYSDIHSFQAMLKQHDIDCECIHITFENQALFVSPYAYLAQSRDGRLAILCFRGTLPTSTFTWVMSLNARMSEFSSGGRVHRGFYRASSSVWSQLRFCLDSVLKGTPLCRIFRDIERTSPCAPPGPAGRAAGSHRRAQSEPDEERLSALEGLYITGHSLGGALAVLTAAQLYTRGEYKRFRRLLRGVYTFGQPMVGDRTFARTVGQKFEHKLFRYVYRKDVVPRLPPGISGRFEHFGREYTARDSRWVIRRKAATQAPWWYMPLGLWAVFIEQVSYLQRPLFRWLRPCASWSDHSPLNYLEASEKIEPGSEFD